MQGGRRLLGKALMAFTWLFATLVTVYILAMALDPPPYWEEVPKGVKVPGILFAVGILSLTVTWAVLKGREIVKGEGSQYLLSRTSEGTARISLRAIQTSLQRRVRDMPDVIGVRLLVKRPATSRLRVEVSYTTTEDKNAIVVSEKLRKALRERFRELVQAEEGFELEFDVKIDGFVPSPGGSDSAESEPEEEPFTGPRYPID